MKRFTLWLLIGLLPTPLWAQVRVLYRADTLAEGVRPAELNRHYVGLFVALGPMKRPQMDTLRKRQIAYVNSFERFTRAEGNLPRPGVLVEVAEYVGADGRFHYVLVDVPPTTSDSVRARLLGVLRRFYAQTTYPVRPGRPFMTTTLFSLGRYVPPRTIRTGDSTLSSLEAARQTTRPDTVKHLFLHQSALTAVPEVVYRFPNLEALDLSKNDIRTLPARLTTELPRLRQLSLLYNQLTDDSVFFGRNRQLRALNIQGNRLTRVPDKVVRNRRLESLWLGGNALAELNVRPLRRLRRLNDLNLYNAGLTELPRGIGRLRRLQVLDLYHNELKQVPTQLGRLPRLRQLAVSHNQLRELPAQLARLKKLEELYAHHNQLSTLPARFARLRRLRVLDIGYNWFSVWPDVVAQLPALQSLDMSNNNLQQLPDWLGGLAGLKTLYLRQNPITLPPTRPAPYGQIVGQLRARQTEVFD